MNLHQDACGLAALQIPEAAAISYAQCWEDADTLLAALEVQPGDTCLSIASGGDNTLALLTRNPARVVALDRNPAQLACLALRMAAYRRLTHGELLELVGSRPSARRLALYQRCRGDLPPAMRGFWDARPAAVDCGIGAAGRFERYLALFREHVLPLAQPPERIAVLLHGGTPQERTRFYDQQWDHWRWRLLFRLFFGRWMLARFGRDAGCLRHAPGALASHLLARCRHALTALDPADNPYLQWLCSGRHGSALPLALRPQHFETIRSRLDRVELRCAGLAQALNEFDAGRLDRCNLSDVFEFQPPAEHQRELAQLARAGHPGTRLVYWNLLAQRQRPPALHDRLRPLSALAQALHAQDKAFFYRALVIEEVV